MTSLDSLPAETGVLVIGGGPNGFVASILLSMRGIDHVLVERRPDTQKAPAAHVIRHRPLEVLSQLGIREEIRAAIAPLSLENINWCTTLGGPEVGRLDLRGGRPPADDPLDETWINLSQSRLEPILANRAKAMPPATIAFGVEASEIEQDDAGVTTTICDADGREQTLRSRWVIAADGAGSRTRKRIGIEMEGQGPLANFMMVHFRADLTPWIDARPGPLFWIMNPESGGTIIVHDPKQSYVFMTPALGVENEADTMEARLRQALGPEVDVPIEIVSTDAWMPFNQVASRYREGRVFLAGDAAHRFPPTGGLGLNTGVLDVHNLVWKLAMVDAGEASDALLDSYEAECRPAAKRNADTSFQNMLGLASVHQAVGPFDHYASLCARLEGHDATEKAALQAAIDSQYDHFASDGAYPEAVGATDDNPTLRGAADYARISLIGPDETKGRSIAVALARESGIEIGFEPSDASRPAAKCWMLTRPDGVVVGQQETPDGSAETTTAVLSAMLATELRG